MVYTYYSTPSHGYLQVPTKDVTKVNAKISDCSFVFDNLSYLEEDCDMPSFIMGYIKKYGEEPKIREVCVDYNMDEMLDKLG
jgi:hypothetical protein